MQRLRVARSERVKIEGCSLLGLRASTCSYKNPKAVSMDASPARLISSRALFLYMVQLIVPAAMWREGCPLACCRFCMAAPAFKKKTRKTRNHRPQRASFTQLDQCQGYLHFHFENDNTSTVTGTAASKGEDILLVLRYSMFCFFHLL